MTKSDQQFLTQVISHYLKAKPFFYCFIRPQEALLFYRHQKLIKPPVLDFGSGDGFFARLAIKNPPDYGLDLPHTGIESPLAKQVYRQRLIYDGGRIPLQDNSVRTVVSNCVFEHVLDITQSFQEMYRVLKPGGYLLASMLTQKWEDYLLGQLLIGKPYLSWLRKRQIHRNLYSAENWQQLAHRVGFTVTISSGYMSLKNSRRLELAHYLSIPQLLIHQVTHRWSFVFPTFAPSRLVRQLAFISLRDLTTSPASGACLFLVAHKSSSNEA